MEDAFRFNAERGEYGPGEVEEQVRERVELARKFLPHRFERVRPNGTVLEIVGNPIEGGGFVTTYTDISERKRAEETLREHEAALEAFALLEADDPKARQAFAALIGQYGEDPLAMFHLGRLLAGASGLEIGLTEQ